jgi:hypothetical protein
MIVVDPIRQPSWQLRLLSLLPRCAYYTIQQWPLPLWRAAAPLACRAPSRAIILARSLQANTRIDGLYLYVSTSTSEALEQRLAQRPTGAPPPGRRLCTAQSTAAAYRAPHRDQRTFRHMGAECASLASQPAQPPEPRSMRRPAHLCPCLPQRRRPPLAGAWSGRLPRWPGPAAGQAASCSSTCWTTWMTRSRWGRRAGGRRGLQLMVGVAGLPS